MTPGRVRGAVVALVAAAGVLTGCTATGGADERAAAPRACLDPAEATRGSVDGTAVWARFCPGPERAMVPAEVPSEALVTHLDLLAGLVVQEAAEVPAGWPCAALAGGRSYEVQIGYADGTVAVLTGRTDPDCTGWFGGGEESALPDGLDVRGGEVVAGPDGLGVYGLVMTAFGRQYADGFEDAADPAPLVCPENPADPDSVSVEGPSTSVDSGYFMGERAPMVMPLTAVRGITCTWAAEGEEPEVRQLDGEEAERVRIGLHAITGGVADCAAGAGPVVTAVIEDRTGTRRAVTVDEPGCSVVRSDRGPFGQGYGLDFAWLDR